VRRRADLYRRAFDLAASLVLVALTLPVLVLVTLTSAAALRAWPLFVQDRIGRGGKPFRFVKVRTLPVEVPVYVDKHALASYEVPAVCQVLRKLHLDELPQLALVLLGRMSLVGPRPEMAHLHEGMGAFGAERTAVRPGCTGLWQVSESCTGLIGAAPEYDRFYLHHRSLRLDLWILFRTALKMTGIAEGVTIDGIPGWVVPAGADGDPTRVIDLTVESERAPSLATSR
jgi:lipopolysaccharide/colanic/teichoic acid biosynthesis glycosyltransferase